MSGGYLWRYTELPSLISMLTIRTLTLLDPQSWKDKNDSYYMKRYRDELKLKSLLALCFTQDTETYHHWSVFAKGTSGVCIRFKRNEFIEKLRRHRGIRVGAVRYVQMPDMRKSRLSIDELPFIKRYGFRHEDEFRVVYSSRRVESQFLNLPISLKTIERVILSPCLPSELRSPVVSTLHQIRGCSNLEIVKSSLINNKEWRNYAQKAMSNG